MTDPNVPSSPTPEVAAQTKVMGSDEISIEDLDRLLEEEDPEFAKQLAEVRLIETDTSILIESSVETDDSSEPMVTNTNVVVNLTPWEARRKAVVDKVREYRLAVSNFISQSLSNVWTAIRTSPKRALTFVKDFFKQAQATVMAPLKVVAAYSRAQKIALAGSFVLILCCLALLVANLKGIWLPYLNEPILGSFANVSDAAFSYEPNGEVELFYQAFPQEAHQYLFSKIKVNLKRTAEHVNPMGAFEIIVSLDSRDTAIEMGSREVEFYDLTQRTIEDETYESLESEIGKQRFKSRLKREISDKLTQGWVRDINFKTFVLKP